MESSKKSKKSIVFSLGFVLFLGLSIFVVSSMSNTSNINLVSGRNIFSFNVSNQFNVSILTQLNPEIQVVSYQKGNETVGYVNFFNGLGKDFEIENGVDYEIYSSKNATLVLP
jgi:hypothetical protein